MGNVDNNTQLSTENKPAYGYVRVSTAKQGEGVSLEVQQEVIKTSATGRGYFIERWFVEKETAAKRGRPVFNEMLKLLKRRKVWAVFIHKIDRSARNWHDWATLGDFVDAGVEVHFANEHLDLRTRGGRLAADIQAAVSTDYIRNLREEAKKGQNGRLKQGLWPWPAPIGYRNGGKGKCKAIDPVLGPLVRLAFELYASRRYTLDTLTAEMNKAGLRNTAGRPVCRNTFTWIFRNPFYTGLIYVRRRNEYFQGKHEPLVSQSLFDRVQKILSGKTKSQGWRHGFLYRQSVRCGACHRSLVAEQQKGHIYYRCHTKTCRGMSFREETISEDLRKALGIVRLHPSEIAMLRAHMECRLENAHQEQAKQLDGIRLHMTQLDDREMRLTDAVVDGVIDKATFAARKGKLLTDRSRLVEREQALVRNPGTLAQQLKKKLELIETLSLSGTTAEPDEIRDLAKRASSNLVAHGKNIAVDWVPWIAELKDRVTESSCALDRDSYRTDALPAKWIQQWAENMEGDDSQGTHRDQGSFTSSS